MLAKTRHISTGRMPQQEVLNAEIEHLGEIWDMMIDIDTGRVAYAVLSFGGGFMGMGNKLFAVPWQKLHLLKPDSRHEGHLDRKFILNVPKDQLENAPGFDRDNWPDLEDLDWLQNVYAYYGCDPYWI